MDALPKSMPPVVDVFSSGRESEARLADGEPEGDAGESEARDRRLVGGMAAPAIGESQNQSPSPGEPPKDDGPAADGVPDIDGLVGRAG